MQEIRNIAIIAHVDHGKTTLVDRMIYQARLVRDQEKLGELILDNNDLERERGITILAKNVSVIYKGVKINIIDAQYGGRCAPACGRVRGLHAPDPLCAPEGH